MVNPIMKFFATGTATLSSSMAASLDSEWQHFDQQTSAHNLAWTGTPVGVFSVELSLDGTNVDQTLVAADFSPALVAPAGSASRFGFQIKCGFPYRRIKYTATSGTGVLSGSSVERAA